MTANQSRSLKLTVVLAAAVLLAGVQACRSTKQPTANQAPPTPPASQPPAPQIPFDLKESAVIVNDSPFNHARPEHQTRTKDCGFCHERVDNGVTPTFPGHQACNVCHDKDFSDRSSKMCTTCHTTPVDVQGTRISFPARMSEFGLKGFSHKDHMNPEKMAGQEQSLKCDNCHRFADGVRASYPSHQQCYSCHIHQANQKLGECGVCHADTKVSLKFVKGVGTPFSLYNFKHASHMKAASCDRCHRLMDNPAKQVRADINEMSTARGQRHTSGCWSCHSQAKESVCTKCHKGSLPF